ncbi:MAG: hypothetical protein N2C12_05455, partial [Planctomycetales bacterium]
MLVALRISIGWYFFESSRQKNLDRQSSSVGFLSQATGPLANLYKSSLPDFHEFRTWMSISQQATPNPHDRDQEPEQWQSFNQRSYSDWQKRIVNDWGSTKDEVVGHFSFEENQSQKALEKFNYYDGLLSDHFLSSQQSIAEYRHELHRLEQFQNSSSAGEVPFQLARIRTKQAEIRGAAATIQAEVRLIEDNYKKELRDLATSDQLKKNGNPPISPDPMASFDVFIKYTLFAIGACLTIGLFSRLASLGAGLFLLTVVGAQPPWVVGYSTIGYQIVMMFA